MVRDNNIRIRIFKNRLLYVLVCVLSGLTAIPLLAILGEVLIKDGNSWDGHSLPRQLPMHIRRCRLFRRGRIFRVVLPMELWVLS